MKYIALSGAVCAGKTTLLGRLMDALGERAAAHEERPQDNPFIRNYYADARRWSFHAQAAFLSLYFERRDWLRRDREFFFFDRCLIENLVIARYRLLEGELTSDEYRVLERIARGMEALMPPIDRYIYLRCPAETLAERLRTRGMDYEGELGLRYAERLKALYDDWAQTLPRGRTLVLDDGAWTLEDVLSFIEA